MADTTITKFAEAFVNGQARAHEDFSSTLVELYGISLEDARKVTNFFIRERIARYTHTMQRYDVTHGAFLEPDVIARGVEIANRPEVINRPARKSHRRSK